MKSKIKLQIEFVHLKGNFCRAMDTILDVNAVKSCFGAHVVYLFVLIIMLSCTGH